jgi:Fic family protein
MFSLQDVMVCAREVERQKDTPMHVAYLLRALNVARNMNAFSPTVNEDWIRELNAIVDNGDGNYRKIPATFNQGMPAINAENIPNVMANLVKHQDMLTYEEFVYEFLKIHPFEDGNGRVAFLLFNLLKGTIQALEPLPEFTFD